MDKIRTKLILALTRALNEGKVLDVSKLDIRKGTGMKHINVPKTHRSTKKGILIQQMPVVSDNLLTYEKVMQILGPEYIVYSQAYNQQFITKVINKTIFSMLPPELIQKIMLELDPNSTINFCTALPICDDDVFWKIKVDQDYLKTHPNTKRKPSTMKNDWIGSNGFTIYKHYMREDERTKMRKERTDRDIARRQANSV